MKRCFPESSLPPSSLPPFVGRLPGDECTLNSTVFNMRYASMSRTTNGFLVWRLRTGDTGVFLMLVCLSACLSTCLSHTFLPLSPAGLYSSSGQSGQWAARQSRRAWSPPFWNRSRWVGMETALMWKEVSEPCETAIPIHLFNEKWQQGSFGRLTFYFYFKSLVSLKPDGWSSSTSNIIYRNAKT